MGLFESTTTTQIGWFESIRRKYTDAINYLDDNDVASNGWVFCIIVEQRQKRTASLTKYSSPWKGLKKAWDLFKPIFGWRPLQRPSEWRRPAKRLLSTTRMMSISLLARSTIATRPIRLSSQQHPDTVIAVAIFIAFHIIIAIDMTTLLSSKSNL